MFKTHVETRAAEEWFYCLSSFIVFVIFIYFFISMVCAPFAFLDEIFLERKS